MWVCTCSKCLDILTWDELVLVTGTPRKQVRVHSEELSTALERKKTTNILKVYLFSSQFEIKTLSLTRLKQVLSYSGGCGVKLVLSGTCSQSFPDME